MKQQADKDGGQQKEESCPLEAPAPRKDQAAASSMAAAAAEKEEARTHISGWWLVARERGLHSSAIYLPTSHGCEVDG